MDITEVKRINRLIIKISKLDKSAIGEIFDLIGGRMYSIAVSIVKNKSLAEEVVSESLLKIVNNADKFTKMSNGYAWICKIVHNTALNVLERENFFTNTVIDEIAEMPDIKFTSDALDEAAMLEESFKYLNKKELEIIRLKYWEDLKIRDIAKRMGMPLTTTQDFLTKTVEKLKNYINKR